MVSLFTASSLLRTKLTKHFHFFKLFFSLRNEPPNKGGAGNYNQAASTPMSFADMQANARKDIYKGKSDKPGGNFKSAAPRLQDANAASPFSQSQKATPGPGAATPDPAKVTRKAHGGSFAGNNKRF